MTHGYNGVNKKKNSNDFLCDFLGSLRWGLILLIFSIAEIEERDGCIIDETGFHNDLTDVFDSEIIVKADFVPFSTI